MQYHHFIANRWGNNGYNDRFIFLNSKITADGDCSCEIKRHLLLGRKAMTNLHSMLKSRDINLPTKCYTVKAIVFPVVVYECESWTIKKAECPRIDAFWSVVLEKTLESLLDTKEIKPVNPKGNWPWIFIGRTDAEAEYTILWPRAVKSWLIGRDLDTENDWRQEEKMMTDEEMVGWHWWLNGHELEQSQGDGEEQGNLVCYSPWGCKESDITEQLNNKPKT